MSSLMWLCGGIIVFGSSVVLAKGQITSKGLFGILGFFQKTNEQIRF
jgi:hypothetical protein